MNKKRNERTMIIIAIVLAVTCLSVAFAALSQVLTINGSGTLKGNTWSISFDNLQDPILKGRAAIDNDATLINNSTTMNFSVSLYQPGDSVTYLFDVKNSGSINAKISAINLTGINDIQAADITYTLTYDDNSKIDVGDTLNAGIIKKLKLVLAFNENATSVPATDIELSLGATIDYTQQ